MPDATAGKTYYGVQILRGVAALLVVMLHATLLVQKRLDPSAFLFFAGNAGVDIFFAISGFTMVITTARHWGQSGAALPFLKRRIIRIVPLYWLVTAVEIIALLAAPSVMRHPPLMPWNTIASFLFIPAWNAEHHAHPVVDVGWTLSFEMLFYALFAAALALRVSPVVWLTPLLLAISALNLFGVSSDAAPFVLVDPILLEFVFGMLVGQAALASRTLPYPVAVGAIALMIPILCVTNFHPTEATTAHRHILWGMPGALMLWGVVSLEERMGPALSKLALPCLLGDASYALYLTHDLVMIAFVALLAGTHPADGLMFALCVLLSCLVGVAIHLGLERPLLKRRHVAYKRASL